MSGTEAFWQALILLPLPSSFQMVRARSHLPLVSVDAGAYFSIFHGHRNKAVSANVYSALPVVTRFSPRPPAEFIPPVQEPYQYIIFRASEVKDLAVDDPAPRRSVHDDPAVLGVSAHL
jgi:hypothetical protein